MSPFLALSHSKQTKSQSLNNLHSIRFDLFFPVATLLLSYSLFSGDRRLFSTMDDRLLLLLLLKFCSHVHTLKHTDTFYNNKHGAHCQRNARICCVSVFVLKKLQVFSFWTGGWVPFISYIHRYSCAHGFNSSTKTINLLVCRFAVWLCVVARSSSINFRVPAASTVYG